jgi:hypothetical protein
MIKQDILKAEVLELADTLLLRIYQSIDADEFEDVRSCFKQFKRDLEQFK